MATQFAVDLVFKSQTQQLDQVANKIQRFERDLAKLQGQNPFEGAERGARGAAAAVDKVGASAKRAESAFSGLRTAVLTLGVGAFVKTIYSAAAEIERTKTQLKTLTGSAGEAERVFSQLQQINKQSPFELKDLTNAASRLSAFGVAAKDLVDTTARLGKVAAGTGQDIDGIATAYGQVMAKGRLQGEELLQFQERGIDLGGELQRMLGVNKEQFAQMAQKGQISSQLVAEAIKNMTNETGRFGKAFENTAGSMDAKLSNLKDAFFNAAAALGKAFEPVFKWMIDQLTTILTMVSDAINRWQGVQNLTPERTGQLRSQAEAEANKRFPGFNPFSSAKGDFYNKRLNELTDAEVAKVVKASQVSTLTAKPAPAPGVAPDAQARYRSMLTQGSGGGSGKKGPTGRVIEYLTGDKSSSGYRADHGGNNYHEHLAFQTAQQMQLAMKALQAAGIKIGSTTGGRHAAGSYHYSGQALDVPAAQVPVGQEQMLSKMVREVLAKAGFVGQGIGGEGGSAIGEILADYRDKLADSFKEGAKLTVEMQRQLELMTASDEHARKLLEIENEYQDRKAQINELLDKGQQTVLNELNDRTRNLEIAKEEVSVLYEKLGVQDLLSKSYQGGSGAFRTDVNLDPNQKTGKLAQYMTDLQTQLNDTEGMITSLAGTVESELGSAMSNAIVGLIDGTQTAEQAFSQMFKNIGKAFIDMATQMIAKAIVMKILGIAFGGGGGGGLFSGAGPVALPGGSGFAGGFSMPKLFAEGGYVTGPTSAVIGEGGQSEYVIPASKMSSAMANYKAGKRGDSILSDPAGGAADDTSGAAIDINYSVTEINSMRFVTEDQFQAGLHQAAKRGAEGGFNKTMGSLKNSRSQRSRIGLR